VTQSMTLVRLLTLAGAVLFALSIWFYLSFWIEQQARLILAPIEPPPQPTPGLPVEASSYFKLMVSVLTAWATIVATTISVLSYRNGKRKLEAELQKTLLETDKLRLELSKLTTKGEKQG
jgi:hypothetical protein